MIAVMHKPAISAITRVLCAMEYGNAKAVKSVINICGTRFLRTVFQNLLLSYRFAGSAGKSAYMKIFSGNSLFLLI